MLKAKVWKWTKRISLGFIGFCVVIVLLAQIFGHPPDKTEPQKITESTTWAQVANNLTGSSAPNTSEKPQNLANTGTSTSSGTNVTQDKLQALSDEKKKEIYFGYRTIQAIPVETLLQGKDISTMSSMQRAELMGSLIKEKETVLAQANGLEYEDIDKIVGYAIQKGWNNEFGRTTPIVTKEDRGVLLEYMDKEMWLTSVRCKDAVKDKLKSLSSADFPFPSKSQFAVVEDRIVMSSYVDAKNEFWAEMRNYFKCYVVPGEDWPQVKSIVFSE